ncbi:MAG: hypothetical protein KatS3mg113_1062 [Planctomycetaceae bacterium]|nr:MAG: hypothetical protein KatS3mg113_1062 [Planctomycetaceae bacterium]
MTTPLLSSNDASLKPGEEPAEQGSIAVKLPPLRKTYRMNGGLFLATVGLIAVLAAGAHFLRNWNLSRNAGFFLQLAQKALGEEKHEQALKFYQLFLQFQRVPTKGTPEAVFRAEILIQAADLQAQLSSTPSALRRCILNYEEAIRLDPSRLDGRRKLIPLLMRMQRYHDAIVHLESLRERATTPDAAAHAWYRIGICRERLNELIAARQAYARAIRLAPQRFSPYLALVALWSRQTTPSLLSMSVDGHDDWPELLRWQQRDPGVEYPFESAIVLLLNRMVAHHPGYEGELVRARTLTLLHLPGDSPPIDPQAADELELRLQIMLQADADMDGVLTGDEIWHVSVPALSDLNHDGTVTREEIVNRLALGDRLARLQEARSVLNRLCSAPDAAEDDLLAEARLTLIDLLTELGLSAGLGLTPDDVSAGLSIKDLISAGLRAGKIDHRFRLADVQERYRELLALTETQPDYQPVRSFLAELQQELQRLRAAYPVPQEKASPDLTDEDDWDRLWEAPDPAVTITQMEYVLAQSYVLLATGVKDTPAEALQLLDQAEEVILHMRREHLAPAAYLLLQYRIAWLTESLSEGEQRLAIRRDKLLALAPRLQEMVGLAGSNHSREAAELLGVMLQRINNLGAALDIYRRQIQVDPFWIHGRMQVAAILTRLGRMEEAIAEYQRTLRAIGAAENLARLLMIQQMMRPAERREWSTIEAVLQVAQRSASNVARVIALESELVGLKALTDFELSQAHDDPTLRQRARERLQRGEEQLKQALESHPNAPEVWSALAQLYLRRIDLTLPERRSKVLNLLQQARSTLGPQVEFTLIELSLALQESQKQGITILQRLEAEIPSFPRSQRARLILALEEAYRQLEQPVAARALLVSGQQQIPDDVDIHLRLMNLLLQQNLVQDAEGQQLWEATLKQIAGLEGTEEASCALLKAQRLLRELPEKDPERTTALEQVRTWLNQALNTRPYLPLVRRLLGLTEELAGRLNLAVEQYRKALDLGDWSPGVIDRLVYLYYTRHVNDRERWEVDLEEAHRLLLQVAEQRPKLISGELARLAWQIEWNRGQVERAGAIASQVARESEDPRDIIVELTLDLLSGRSGDEVLEKFRSAAYEQAPHAGMVWLLYLRYLIRHKLWEQAEQVARDAEEPLTVQRTPEALLAVATLWDLLSVSQGPRQSAWQHEATRRYDQVLTEFPADLLVRVQALDHFLIHGNTERARSLINYLLDPVRTVPDEVRALARRRLAVLESRAGNYGDTLRAIVALQEARQSGRDLSSDNLRLQLRLLQRMREVDTRQEQKLLLLELQKQDRLNLPEQLRLAQLTHELGDWPTAQQLFRELVQQHRQHAGVRAAYLSALLPQAVSEPELMHEIQQHMDELRRVEPRSWRTARLYGDWLVLQDQPDQAVDMVRELVEARLIVKDRLRVELWLEQENPVENIPLLAMSESARGRRDLLDALQLAVIQCQQGRRDVATQILYESPARDLIEEALLTSVLDAAQWAQRFDAQLAETWLRRLLDSAQYRQAAIELARLFLRAGRIDDALVICEEQWDRLTPPAVALILSQIASRLPPEQSHKLDLWKRRLQSSATELTPLERCNLFLFLGNAENELGHYDLAMDYYQLAKEADPEYYVPLNNFAFLAAKLQRSVQEASEAIDAALQLVGPRSELADTKATVLIAQGKPQDARDYLRPLTQTLADPVLLFRLAECYLTLNDRERARQTIEQAVQRGLSAQRLHPLDRPLLQELLRLRTSPAG